MLSPLARGSDKKQVVLAGKARPLHQHPALCSGQLLWGDGVLRQQRGMDKHQANRNCAVKGVCALQSLHFQGVNDRLNGNDKLLYMANHWPPAILGAVAVESCRDIVCLRESFSHLHTDVPSNTVCVCVCVPMHTSTNF